MRSRIRGRFGRIAVAESIFRDDARKHEIEQVFRSTGFGTASGHFESAERMASDDCPGDGAIDVKISDLKLGAHAFDGLRAT